MKAKKKQQQSFPYQHLAVLGLDGAQKYVPPSASSSRNKAPASASSTSSMIYYTLQERVTGSPLGVYTSLSHLKNGVDYWIKQRPDKTYVFFEWKPNNPIEPHGWDFAYIHTNDDRKELEAGGGSAPPEKDWGKNLIGGFMDEYGIFSDDGQLERGFSSAEEAQIIIREQYSPEDRAYVARVCHDHPEQEAAYCDECDEDE